MKTLIKLLMWLVLAVVVVVGAAIVLIPMLVDPNDYKAEIADATKAQTGRELKIEGDLKREYRSYSRPLETHNAKTIVSRSLSPLVIGWGLGSIASVSVISSVLAVERNSRKD